MKPLSRTSGISFMTWLLSKAHLASQLPESSSVSRPRDMSLRSQDIGQAVGEGRPRAISELPPFACPRIGEVDAEDDGTMLWNNTVWFDDCRFSFTVDPKVDQHAQERTNNQDVLDVGTGHRTREGTREDARPVRSANSPGRRVHRGDQAHVQRTERKGTPQEHARASIRLVPLDELYIVALKRVHEHATRWFPEIEQVWAVTERMKGPTSKWIDDLTSTGGTTSSTTPIASDPRRPGQTSR
ncbi:hypothetical protein K466DRAFT_381854 [Polyporus arcularius HHB13444]|uniref:Uncharacterized protein n=1 Tax=Polyporus arcularius HHB13444 TaxID=1314778 RepID=A0A5C3NUF6_9APHY|nr:hypothetical protein K466DRAFT_381854 [Polyporus arcularius HHB13444]